MATSPLRRELEAAVVATGLSMDALTVMANDPFRLDTPANHRIAAWLADTCAELRLGNRQIHLRGMHYMILGATRPDGRQYVSDEDSWSFLERAAKAARWLGSIPFDQIIDQRNSPPETYELIRPEPTPYLTVGIDVRLPSADAIAPKLGLHDFRGVQPYRIVWVGEKSSLGAVLAPIAREFEIDVYLPTGNISDTMVYRIAKEGSADGRPLVVQYFADADPAGWGMATEIAHKLRAFSILHFPDLDYQVHRVALTPRQVREFGLPSTPLKPTEKRAGAWFEAFGVEQTEIDALATLRPELLARLAREAVAPFRDSDLDRRVAAAREEWFGRALVVIDDSLDAERLGRIRVEAAAKLDEMRQQIAELNAALRIDVDDFDLPPISIPEARTLGSEPQPLYSSRWSLADASRRLIASRTYKLAEDTR
ncbi:MAG TPA: hypothetical protein VHA75_08045 [Rugosimonospora sp.]|nr:hypothetical protein [Rugosimonospora sp.]